MLSVRPLQMYYLSGSNFISPVCPQKGYKKNDIKNCLTHSSKGWNKDVRKLSPLPADNPVKKGLIR